MTAAGAAVVRTARPDADAAEVAGLLHQLGYPDNTEPEVRDRLAAWSADADAVVLVADVGGRVAGVVAVAAVPYLEKPGRWARIVSLVVANDVRGRGIGRQLVGAAEAAALELDCVGTEVTSARRRVRAHEFYRANGYEDWTGDVTRLFHKQLRAGVAGPVEMAD